ncbi:hypothetical protein [Sphaerisporangium perillae]|uniref:hypothetical protein n=1 Tax=Sphaerisporangium perillae TaxID=2935860 RepID=UPI0020109FAD|nr:hypothetical protein [Sphaerisporangium perillae]
MDHYRAQSPAAVMDQTTLSRLESFPGYGSRAPLATHIITLASVYRTTPLTLLEPNSLDRLDSQERDLLIRCNPGFSTAPPNLGALPLLSLEDEQYQQGREDRDCTVFGSGTNSAVTECASWQGDLGVLRRS